MGIGAKSIAMVILEKANAKDKTDSEKLSDIINFCNIGLGNNIDKKEKEQIN